MFFFLFWFMKRGWNSEKESLHLRGSHFLESISIKGACSGDLMGLFLQFFFYTSNLLLLCVLDSVSGAECHRDCIINKAAHIEGNLALGKRTLDYSPRYESTNNGVTDSFSPTIGRLWHIRRKWTQGQ